MACGTPVVVSDSGALPEVVGEAALVVAEGDVAELAKAIGEVVHDADVADRLRAAGLDRRRRPPGTASRSSTTRCTAPPRSSGPTAVARRPTGRSRSSSSRTASPTCSPRRWLRSARLSVTVVDNSSSPAVRAVADAAGARYVDPGRNGGFGAGVNEALRRRRPPAPTSCSSTPTPSSAPEDVDALRSGPARRARPRERRPVAGRRHRHAVTRRVALPVAAGDVGRGRRPRPPPARPLRHRLRAAAAPRGHRPRRALRRRALLPLRRGDRLGRTARACSAGGTPLVPAARATHVGAATSTDPARREGHFHAAQEIYLRKHFGAVGWQVGRAGQVAGSAVRASCSAASAAGPPVPACASTLPGPLGPRCVRADSGAAGRPARPRSRRRRPTVEAS